MQRVASLNMEPRRASDIWSAAEWRRLAEHLHNENEPVAFVMGFRREDGSPQYVRSKRHPVDRMISWAWSTILARAKSKIAFAPYAMNSRRESRWGGMDFDAHDGRMERAQDLAFRALAHLLPCPSLSVILEKSGGGFHLWAISEDFYPAPEWVRFLKRLAREIGTPIHDGICEIFPHDDDGSCKFGRGMRVPGCWNPRTDTLSEILFQNCDDLLSRLSGKPVGKRHTTGYSQIDFPDKEKSISFSSLSLLYRQDQWLTEFAIVETGTRNSQLTRLVGQIFYQVGVSTAEALVRAQFQRKTVTTKASLDEHLKAFRDLWAGLNRRWRESLSVPEKAVFDSLDTDNERDAFRIILSYARKAAQDTMPDFPLARDNLAQRLGVTPPGAAWIRDKFASLGVIRKAQDYVANKRAARFKWLL